MLQQTSGRTAVQLVPPILQQFNTFMVRSPQLLVDKE
jgi:hypothetical protein